MPKFPVEIGLNMSVKFLKYNSKKFWGLIKMKDEKILQDEIMSEDELENVAGGNRLETFEDGNELYKRGLLSAEDALHSAPVRDMLHKMGYAGYEDKGGLINSNIYTDKAGNKISREDFWKNFDSENGTKIVK